jgi:hypothetical protein
MNELIQLATFDLATVTGGAGLADAVQKARTDFHYAKQRVHGLGQITSSKGAADYLNLQRNLDRPGSTVQP